MSKRLIKEKKITNDYFKLNFGCLNRDEMKTFYFEGTAYVMPTEDDDYEAYFRMFTHKMKAEIDKIFAKTGLISKGFIFDIDIASSWMKVNKKSCLNYQVVFAMNNNNTYTMKEITEYMCPIIVSVSDVLLNNLTNRGFVVTKTK